LLKNGKESYINQDPKVLEILNRLHIIPVQRNKGIDGFLKTEKSFKPIPVRIQKDNETLENAINLITSSLSKKWLSAKNSY
jgi:site-specific DNA-methyltransferase (adenine-specific)